MCLLCGYSTLHGSYVLDGNAEPTSPGTSFAASPPGETEPTGQLPGTDTVPGSTATGLTHANDTVVRGYVNFGGDQDWYRITLTAGQTYTFAMNGIGAGAIDDPYLRLLNSSGVEIAFDDDSGPIMGARLTFTAGATGTYYLSAGGYSTGDTGQYLLTMNDGTTPYIPVVSVTDVATYLTNTYWEVNGGIAHHWADTSITFNVAGLEPERAVLARLAFQAWSDVANLTFTETTGAAQIMLDDASAGSAYASSSYNGSGIISSAAINVAANWYGGIDTVDSYTFQTFLHEIGHAIGLGHGGPYNGSATYGVDNTYANDSWQLSLMSYMDQADYGGASYRFVMTPQMADILAVQSLYGAPTTTRTGDTTYGFNSTAGSIYNFASYTTAPAFTIYDSSGIDTLNASGYSAAQTIDLRAGYFSSIGGLSNNIAIAIGSTIENATGGSGSDIITGNSANNTLTGGGGNDIIQAGAGTDYVYGELGTDYAVFAGNYSSYTVASVSASTTQVIVNGLEGYDTFFGIEWFQFSDQTVWWQNLSVVPHPDLDAVNLSLSSQSVVGSVTVSYTISNVGNLTAGASTAGIYRSTDGVFDASDTLLTTRSIGSVTAGASINDSFSLSLSTLGTYNIIVVADYANVVTDESSESNNPSNAVQVTASASQINNYPDGSHTVATADWQNQYTWSDHIWFYDSQGRATSQTVNYDSGIHTIQTWDVQSQNTWANYVWSYNAQWQSTSQHVYYDDGTLTVQTWDTQSLNVWSDHVSYYDTLLRQTSQHVNYDSGIHTAQYWDVLNQNSYANFVYQFDSQWRLTAQTVNFDDSTHRVQYWDAANSQSWSTYVTYYDANWNPTSQTGYYDDGTTWNNQYGSPVVLDLDGNGLDIVPIYASTASFDMNGGGQRLPTAWIGGDDGLLALDLGADGLAGADGVIDQAAEIAFSLWAPGTTSDLEGLRFAFDTNHDGRLDSADARWNEFRVWTDSNSDGVSATSEVKTLAELGIVAVDLDPSAGSSAFADGTTIQGLSSFTRSDGSTGVVGDLIFAYGTDPFAGMPDIASGSDIVAEVPALSTLLPSDFHLV